MSRYCDNDDHPIRCQCHRGRQDDGVERAAVAEWHVVEFKANALRDAA
jgi:hypothetical protein